MSISFSGDATPRAQSRTSQESMAEATSIRDLLAAMKDTLGTLGQTFDTLNEQSAKISATAPTMQDNASQIQAMRRQVRAQDKKQEARIKEVKRMVSEQLKDQIIEHMKAKIQEQIKADIAKQVAQEVDVQIKDYFPVPVEQQMAQSKKELTAIQQSVENSEARRLNSNLRTHNLDEPLAIVLKTNGRKSYIYPTSLRALFSYDGPKVKALLRDYELIEDEVRERNLNRFMSYIGIRFQLIPVPAPVGLDITKYTIPLLIWTSENYDPSLELVCEAYRRMTHPQLLFFLKVRNLPTSGPDSELASRLAHHDLHTYHFPAVSNDIQPTATPQQKGRSALIPGLPVEILAEILDHVGDWTLSRAVGVPTSLPTPLTWNNANSTDLTMLTGSLPLIRAADPASGPPTKIGAVAAVRFGYVNVLEYFLTQHRSIFLSIFKDDIIPIQASRNGRTDVLSWWKHGFEQHPDLVHPPKTGAIADAVDGASRNGQVTSLDWWFSSGIPLEYTEAALEFASAKNQISVLDWWKQHHLDHGLPLKIGRVMDMASTAGHVKVLEWWAASQLDYQYDRHVMHHASCHGKVDVLEWWLGSGLQVVFDQDALTGATRHNRPEVLQWWDKSGLPIQYRMCDIEEALEDAIGGGEAARMWWREKGVDFNANDKEWMKLHNLN
ncbi:hypothetical protein SERLA73DRAFT_71676 [Serpula lacrymans var. lacrymans S7.3]|uniref:Uncharacterized protein n=2 Tax=Serpula lacrymans var. lacrymans TaxID=341189 RepID=F8PS16_SERL3|nr:uncharacterized protein SERLADRAFT_436063 [Serpula lacrymans var. lacrymans S7.9]EGO00682.1 hypothetical protein SERLA73DRAFT_71676 [Serpula lacrymans var. lacrymans S7.3]EGO26234.1 hypothetical protein SERLADRAFT_436063 [Serpula lacrymans var. lacrymans S7.9]